MVFNFRLTSPEFKFHVLEVSLYVPLSEGYCLFFMDRYSNSQVSGLLLTRDASYFGEL